MNMKIKHFLVGLATTIIAFLSALSFNVIEAAELKLLEATYEASYEIGGISNTGKRMIKNNFDSIVKLERIDEYYFISIHQTSANIEALNLKVEDKSAGWMIREDNGSDKITSFTVSLETLSSPMHLSCYIPPMDATKEFTITIIEESIRMVSNTVESIPNRPGFFGEAPSFERQFPMWGYAAIAGGALATGGIALGVYLAYRKKSKNK